MFLFSIPLYCRTCNTYISSPFIHLYTLWNNVSLYVCKCVNMYEFIWECLCVWEKSKKECIELGMAQKLLLYTQIVLYVTYYNDINGDNKLFYIWTGTNEGKKRDSSAIHWSEVSVCVCKNYYNQVDSTVYFISYIYFMSIHSFNFHSNKIHTIYF